jgi:tetratricopeptide (TPR) repeat protein
MHRQSTRWLWPALALLLAAVPVAGAAGAKGAGKSLTGTADPEVDRRLFESNRKGTRLFYDDRFHRAIEAFERSIRIDPESPTGHVLLAGTYQAMMSEYRNRRYLRAMRRHLDQAIALAEKRIDAGEELGRTYEFLGAAYGNLGLYHYLQKNWFRAFRAGRNLSAALQEGLRLRPEIADSDYGYGFFLYWRTIKASIFKWLAGGDQRANGIRRLQRTVARGEICGDLARQSLMGVYLQEERYDDLHRVAGELNRSYPGGITQDWWQGRAYVAQRNWPAARRTHESVFRKLKLKRFHSTEALVEARYFIALSDARTGDRGSAREHLRWILTKEGKVDDDLWLGPDYIELAEELLDSL